MSINQLFYLWIVSWVYLELFGAALYLTYLPMVGLLLMTIGVADVLTPFVIYAQDWERKKINAYFTKRKASFHLTQESNGGKHE